MKAVNQPLIVFLSIYWLYKCKKSDKILLFRLSMLIFYKEASIIIGFHYTSEKYDPSAICSPTFTVPYIMFPEYALYDKMRHEL